MSDLPPPPPPTGGSDEPDDGPTTELAPGTTLWAFTMAHPLLAQEAVMAAMRLQARGYLELDDAAIVHKQEGGKVRIIQTRDVSTSQGALSGSWWGLLAGLFIPGGPLLGAALGAAVGGVFAKMRDIGINDDQMKQMGEQLEAGESAVFFLVTGCHQVRVMHEVGRFEARVLHSTADADLVDEVSGRLAVDPWGGPPLA